VRQHKTSRWALSVGNCAIVWPIEPIPVHRDQLTDQANTPRSRQTGSMAKMLF